MADISMSGTIEVTITLSTSRYHANIYRKDTGSYSLIDTVPYTDLSYQDDNSLVNSTDYTYYVEKTLLNIPVGISNEEDLHYYEFAGTIAQSAATLTGRIAMILMVGGATCETTIQGTMYLDVDLPSTLELTSGASADLSYQHNIRIQRKDSVEGFWYDLAYVSATNDSYQDSEDLEEGTTYYYRVKPHQTPNIYTQWSNEDSATYGITFVGSIDCTSELTGIVETSTPISISGSIAVTSDIFDTLLSRIMSVVGSIEVTTSVECSVVLIIQLISSIDITTTVGGVLSREAIILGQMGAAASLIGSTSLTQSILSPIFISSLLQSQISIEKSLTGIIDPSISLTGTILFDVPLVGSIDTTSTNDGSLSLISGLLGSTSAHATLGAVIDIFTSLSGSIDAIASHSGYISCVLSLGGSIDTTLTPQSSLSVDRSILGSSVIISSLSSTLIVIKHIIGSTDASSSLSVVATVPNYWIEIITGNSTITKTISTTSTVTKIVTGTSTISLIITADNKLGD